MAQARMTQVVRVYVRVASLVLLFLAVTALLYVFLPATPLDPRGSTSASSASSSSTATSLRSASSSSSSSSSASSSSSNAGVVGEGLCSVEELMKKGTANASSSSSSSSSSSLPSAAGSRSPLPSRTGPPRVERFRASVVVPLLALNPNITANLARLLAFLNDTYPLPEPSSSSSSSTSSSSVHGSSRAGSAAAAAGTEDLGLSPVEVLLVVDPLRVPILPSEDDPTALASSPPRPSPAFSSSPKSSSSSASASTASVLSSSSLKAASSSSSSSSKSASSSSSKASSSSSFPSAQQSSSTPLHGAVASPSAGVAKSRSVAVPSLKLAQQWEVYGIKKLLAEYQYLLRVHQRTHLRVLALPAASSSAATSSSTCDQSGGESFGTACNLGASRARGQWLFFLSAETSFDKGWFEEELMALSRLQNKKKGQTHSSDLLASLDGGDVGLVGCKVLSAPSARSVHSVGLDVALSRRHSPTQEHTKELESNPTGLTTRIPNPGSSQAPDGGRKRGRSFSMLDAQTISEWQEEQARASMHELREVMETEANSIGSRSRDSVIAFPFRRLEGVARTDERLEEPAEIIAPSSYCFIVAKSVFHEAEGFIVSSNSPKVDLSMLGTPFLQVLDLALRLRQDSNKKNIYLPTKKAVILHKPEGPWNKEDDTTKEDHGLCASTLFPIQPSPSASPKAFDIWRPYSIISSSTNDGSSKLLFPQQLSASEFTFARLWQSQMMREVKAKRRILVDLIWDFYGGCTGWGLETARFVTSLEPLLNKVAIVADTNSFCKGLPRHMLQSMRRMRSLIDETQQSQPMENDKILVWVSHKPPTSYPTFPYSGTVAINQRPDYVIGRYPILRTFQNCVILALIRQPRNRSMTESDSVPSDWKDYSRRVDEIWLPSSFLVEAFVSGGIPREKLLVLPIPINTQFFSPDPFSKASSDGIEPLALPHKADFNFLSVFKWEQRKGWDLLVEAYVEEFKPEDNTTLYLQTYLPTSRGQDKEAMEYSIKQLTNEIRGTNRRLPRIEILNEELPEQDMPRLYAAVDAFVLPTRGEGFGMPIMEAMAMALPVIATNWSGPTDFMSNDNSYPIAVEAMVPAVDNQAISSWSTSSFQFAGKWAEPSVTHLRQLMRYVYTNRAEAKQKGKQAREDIIAGYRESVIAERVVLELERIERLVRSRRSGATTGDATASPVSATQAVPSSFSSSPSLPSSSPDIGSTDSLRPSDHVSPVRTEHDL